jgi:hypothetical protein
LKNFCSDETAERQQPLHAKQHCAAQHRAEQSLSVRPAALRYSTLLCCATGAEYASQRRHSLVQH